MNEQNDPIEPTAPYPTDPTRPFEPATPPPPPEADDTATEDKRPSLWAHGRHPIGIGYLVMGLAFLVIVGCWALIQTDVVSGDDIRWLMPIPWVVAGAVGLVVTTVVSLRRRP